MYTCKIKLFKIYSVKVCMMYMHVQACVVKYTHRFIVSVGISITTMFTAIHVKRVLIRIFFTAHKHHCKETLIDNTKQQIKQSKM